MDEIRIEDLKIFAYHGVYQEEQENGQDFYVNVTLYTDTRKAGLSDDLTQSTNYGEVCHFINRFLTEHTYKLLEAAAEHLSRALLEEYPLVRSLDLEIRKPQAPIGLPFASVSVRIQRGWHTAYLGIGSNMGDPELHIKSGIAFLEKTPGIRVEKVSQMIVTAPYGGVEQEDFLNGALCIRTYFSPEELLEVLHQAEAEEGRERLIHWGPRTLDLDILFYDDLVLNRENLTIPHIDLQNRDFVLRPLLELAPELRHPISGKTVRRMLQELSEKQ